MIYVCLYTRRWSNDGPKRRERDQRQSLSRNNTDYARETNALAKVFELVGGIFGIPPEIYCFPMWNSFAFWPLFFGSSSLLCRWFKPERCCLVFLDRGSLRRDMLFFFLDHWYCLFYAPMWLGRWKKREPNWENISKFYKINIIEIKMVIPSVNDAWEGKKDNTFLFT